jgi:3-oxoadipate enol-lactonase
MLDRYAEHFDVLAHDQRGLGETEVPPGPYEMTDYAADAAALLDAVGRGSCRWSVPASVAWSRSSSR